MQLNSRFTLSFCLGRVPLSTPCKTELTNTYAGAQRVLLTTDCVGCRDSVDYASDRSRWDNDPAAPCTSRTGKWAACSAPAVCTWQRRGGRVKGNLL